MIWSYKYTFTVTERLTWECGYDYIHTVANLKKHTIDRKIINSNKFSRLAESTKN